MLIIYISIRPSPPSEFDFIDATKMNFVEVDTCESVFLTVVAPFRTKDLYKRFPLSDII